MFSGGIEEQHWDVIGQTEFLKLIQVIKFFAIKIKRDRSFNNIIYTASECIKECLRPLVMKLFWQE